MTQQMLGALGGYAVGLVTHQDAVNLSLMMLALGVLGAMALVLLLARRDQPAHP